MSTVLHFLIPLQNIPPRVGVISMTPQSRPPPPSHPGAPRPIPEVHPGAPRPIPDTHPGAPRPVPSAQAKSTDLPSGRDTSQMFKTCWCHYDGTVKLTSTPYRAPGWETPGSVAHAATYAAPSSCPSSSAPAPTTDAAHTSSSTSAPASCGS